MAHCLFLFTFSINSHAYIIDPTWFSRAIPKFVFLSWFAMRNRLSTMDRLLNWNRGTNTSCDILYQHTLETRDHLFFECSYTSQIWGNLTWGKWQIRYTQSWPTLILIISDGTTERNLQFCTRYALTAVHTIWREHLEGKESVPAWGVPDSLYHSRQKHRQEC